MCRAGCREWSPGRRTGWRRHDDGGDGVSSQDCRPSDRPSAVPDGERDGDGREGAADHMGQYGIAPHVQACRAGGILVGADGVDRASALGVVQNTATRPHHRQQEQHIGGNAQKGRVDDERQVFGYGGDDGLARVYGPDCVRSPSSRGDDERRQAESRHQDARQQADARAGQDGRGDGQGMGATMAPSLIRCPSARRRSPPKDRCRQ